MPYWCSSRRVVEPRLGGGVRFSPNSIIGCVLWLDADLGITLNGANISSWLDRSSTRAELVQATAANQPAFIAGAVNGHSVVDANDANDRLANATQPNAGGLSGFTMFVVFRAATTTGNHVLSSNSVYAHFQLFDGGINDPNIYQYVATGVYGKYQFTAGDTTLFHIAEAVFDGSLTGNAERLKAFLDGTTKTLAFTGTIPATSGTGAGITIGHTVVAFTGQVASYLFFSRTLTAAERSLVRRFMSVRFNIPVVS